jgi:hypothetical protein
MSTCTLLLPDLRTQPLEKWSMLENCKASRVGGSSFILSSSYQEEKKQRKLVHQIRIFKKEILVYYVRDLFQRWFFQSTILSVDEVSHYELIFKLLQLEFYQKCLNPYEESNCQVCLLFCHEDHDAWDCCGEMKLYKSLESWKCY